MIKRQRDLEEPIEGKKVLVYPGRWIKAKKILTKKGSSLSRFVREKIDELIKEEEDKKSE